MGVSTAEKNRRKRERKKKEKEERRKAEEAAALKTPSEQAADDQKDEIEIEYVAESLPEIESSPANEPLKKEASVPDGLPPLNGGEPLESEEQDMNAVLRRFHARAAVASVVTDDERKEDEVETRVQGQVSDDEDEDDRKPMSKRKLREVVRPSVADLKRRVKRPDLVEAHDITAADPDFLIHLKAVPGTVPVPRHWGRKRKYLQGKRGFEKPPFQVSPSTT